MMHGCEVCGNSCERERRSCSPECYRILRTRTRPPLAKRPICPVCHTLRDLRPEERPDVIYRRETCGKPECARQWRAVQARVAKKKRQEAVLAPAEAEQTLPQLSRGSRRGVLARILLGCCLGVEAFSWS